MKKILALVLGTVLSITSVYAGSLDNNKDFLAVEKQLTKNANISGDFEQTRYISGLDNPLKSTGEFSITTDGLVWDQTDPFKSTMKASKDRLEQSIMDNPPTVITREQQPMVFTFTQVFMSVFQGDTTSVESYFNIEFSGDVNGWKITLSPKSSPLDKAIKTIELEGSKTIEHIKVTDAQENIIDIKLMNVKVK